MPSVPWRRVFGWALLGWVLGLAFTIGNLVSTSDDLGGLVDVAPTKPAAGVIAADFPDGSMSKPGGDHDGPMFYAVARDLWRPDVAAASLDRPRYRLQRIVFPAAAWVLHPTGGGPGLVWAMFAVGALGLLGGAVATGALSTLLDGPPWPAAIFPVLLGSVLSLRLSVPDPLALGLAVGAVALSLRSKHVAAVVCATLAVLTREPVWLVVAGFAVWRRDRAGLALAAIPAAVAALWWIWLHLLSLPVGTEPDVIEFTVPLKGWIDAVRFWAQGYEPLGLISAVAGVGLAVAALVRRGLRHPLGWAIVLNLVLVAVLTVSPLAPERNASRTLLPLTLLGIVALAAPATRMERP